VGKRDQDLFELVDKRVKEREERLAARIGSSPSKPPGSLIRPQGTAAQSAVGSLMPVATFNLRPTPLNAVIGNHKGHYGRAVVPTNSPFEERQRLINDKRDENAHDRPAKRRKQNESPPSKNGYAQNLMGATLTLGSAKPPSNATIRYESFRIKPSIQPSPAFTIDLTNVEDKQVEDVEMGRAGINGRRCSAEKPSTIQKPKLQRSPPARSGYASNLSGAALTLSTPDIKLSKRSESSLSLATRVPARTTRQEQVNYSSLDEEDSFVNIDSSGMLPIANFSKPKDFGKKAEAPKAGSKSSSRSSYLRMDLVKSMAKEKSTQQRTPAQESSTARPSLGQPVTALRIKSRPPRRMMMLMQGSSSRSSAPSEPCAMNQIPCKHQAPKPAPNEVVLSQATMQLNSFCQKQEQRLQGRLNGKRSDVDTGDDPSSSPTDSGINAQTIDLSLSRRHIATEQIAPAGNIAHAPLPEPSQKSDLILTRGENNHTGATKPSRTLDSSETPPNCNPGSQALPTSMIKRSSSRACSSRIFSFDSAQSKVQEDNELPSSPKPELLSDSNILEGNNKNLQSRIPATKYSNTEPVVAPSLEVKSVNTCVVDAKSDAVTVATQAEATDSNSLPAKELKEPAAPKHVSDAMCAATDHFRAIIEFSHSPPISTIRANPPCSPKMELEPSRDDVHDLEEVNVNSGKSSVKQSLKSSPLAQALYNERKSNEFIRRTSTNALDNNTESSKIKVQAPNIIRMDPPKSKLVNPATRGRSLHTIAKETVDALAPAFNAMPPSPPPRIPARPGRVIGNDDTVASIPPREPLGDVPVSGPWSREAFDLFGSWRPPTKEPGAETVNG
jgi:hypothetical protein